MNDPVDSTARTAFIHSAIAQVDAECKTFSYPLFAADEHDRPDLYATAVLLECDGSTVLVTAAHAIHEISEAGSQVHVGTPMGIIAVDGFVMSSPRGTDPLDVAAALVPEGLLPNFRPALPLSRTADGIGSQVPMRCIHGYPVTKNETRKRANVATRTFSGQSFTYAGASKDLQSEFVKYKKDAALHVALKYQRNGKDQDGKNVTPPSPKGISGGGLWLVPDIRQADEIFLEGISIEYHKKGSLVFATRIDHVIDFVRRHVLHSD